MGRTGHGGVRRPGTPTWAVPEVPGPGPEKGQIGSSDSSPERIAIMIAWARLAAPSFS